MPVDEQVFSNPGFEMWLEAVDVGCRHFLDDEYGRLEGGVDAWEAYEFGMRPLQFLADILLPYLEYEMGFDLIDYEIGMNIMWGACRP